VAEILFYADGWNDERWVNRFIDALPGFDVRLWGEVPDPARIEYALLWKPQPEIFQALNNLKVIFSLGAGVDHILNVPDLPEEVPVVRVVDPDLTSRMSEYIVLHCLMHLRDQKNLGRCQQQKKWHVAYQPPASAVRVGILGLGELGLDAARKLAMIGFDVCGWSRRSRNIDGIATFYGKEGRQPFLRQSDILVSLLPLTGATRGMINYDLLAQLPGDGALGGPVLINAGRGGLQVEADILKALDDGTLKAATLDVFEHEPLPVKSPLWLHEKVTISPHNAADSDPQAICQYVAKQIKRFEAGKALENIVSRQRGY
jgi:glyoxylate/hydroxypyruvate reductase A